MKPSSILQISTAAAALVLGGCGFSPGQGNGGGGSFGNNGRGGFSLAGSTGTGSGGSSTGGVGVSPDGGNCGVVERPANRVPPDILIVLDRSGSMNATPDNSCMQNCGAASKWSQTTTALNQVVMDTNTTVNWGIKMFGSGNNGCAVNGTTEVPIAPMNATAVVNRINMTNTGSSTPTRAAMEAATTYLNTVTTPNPKFILLATDGLPNCPAAGNTNDSDATAAIASVMTAATQGFPTFVVGIATSSDPTSDMTLSSMAVAGGYPRAGTPSYYPVSSTADLVTALNAIVTIAGSCTYPIPAPPTDNGTTSRDFIHVFANGVEVPHDAANGWEYTDGTHVAIELHGQLCVDIMAGSVADVKIVFECLIG